VTTNPFLAVEACCGPPKLGQVVVHTADVVPLTSNSEAYRGARRPVSFGMAGSVGVCGLLTDGQTYPKTFGGKPKQIAVSDVICGRHPPPTGCMWHCGKAPGAGTLVWRTILWELSGGNWIVVRSLLQPSSRVPISCGANRLSELLCLIKFRYLCGLQAQSLR
jgi:hypothetical protein